jgi:hypothetical protein
VSYSVTWLPDAENELATIWMGAPDRDAVTTASAELDRRLADDPLNEGESRSNGRRIAFLTPLAILYRVHPQTKTVVVTRVWTFRGRRRP